MSAFRHLLADFAGASAQQLGDGALLSGLLIAAAGATGLSGAAAPVVRSLPGDGVTVVLILEDSHMVVHAFPRRGVLLLDVLAPADRELAPALDVFTRRLPGATLESAMHPRG